MRSARVGGLTYYVRSGLHFERGCLPMNGIRWMSTGERSDDRALLPSKLNANVKELQYAVRGELVIRAEKYAEQLKSGTANLPFNEIIYCNIGNPQQVGQKPITFFRQVLSMVEYPELLSNPYTKAIMPEDAIEYAAELVRNLGTGGAGAYTHSKGVPYIRKNVAKFIEARDGHPCNPENIFLTDGASPAVQTILKTLIRDKKDGVLIPIPQYPLYSASLSLFGGKQLQYYLKEDAEWGMDVAEIKRAIDHARKDGIVPRGLAIINPGNPTGQSLEEANMREVVQLCGEENILLLADEVYQTNSYVKPFVSFKKVLKDMGPAYDHVELASFHSVSKGVIGECGKRGGYMELVNIHPETLEEIYKLVSISLCSNVIGQCVVNMMVNPPKSGSHSHELYSKESSAIFSSLKERADILADTFNSLEGMSCNRAAGAMYLFPQIRLPKKAVQVAASEGRAPDAKYCIELLDHTGICVVPGSGFGQQDGTHHFRTTFLPPADKIPDVAARMKEFHEHFMAKYRS